MTLATLTELFGWMSVINVGLLVCTSALLVPLQGFVGRIHARMFKLEEQDLKKAYFQYLAQFKIVVIVFNLAPYLALKIMS
jgi:hypothetical protein